MVFRYGDKYVVTLSGIYMNENGTMGVAVGFTASPLKSRHTSSWVIHDYGLIIFFFDKEGNVLRIVFIPFKEIENNMEQTWGKIKELLGNYGVSMDDFYYVLDALMDFCDEMCDTLSDYSGELAALAIIVGLIFTPPVGVPVATLLGLLAFGFHCDSRTWDHWRDVLEAFQDLVDEDRER